MDTPHAVRVELTSADAHDDEGRPLLTTTFVNEGQAPVALTFWWNRSLEVRDARGTLVQPGPGPVLPCGAGEDWTVIPPGGRHARADGFACTQPAGAPQRIGWGYTLTPGTYRVRFRYQAPPPHGFTQSEPHPQAFVGTLTSDEVVVTVAPRPPRSWWRRLLGGR